MALRESLAKWQILNSLPFHVTVCRSSFIIFSRTPFSTCTDIGARGGDHNGGKDAVPALKLLIQQGQIISDWLLFKSHDKNV